MVLTVRLGTAPRRDETDLLPVNLVDEVPLRGKVKNPANTWPVGRELRIE
jgi:hypothetical protein